MNQQLLGSFSDSPHLLGQDAKSYPVQWIKVVEKLDEGAFHRKHMFQVVVCPSGMASLSVPAQISLYLQAAVSVVISVEWVWSLYERVCH